MMAEVREDEPELAEVQRAAISRRTPRNWDGPDA
jgi:hypothetical protein